MKWMIYIRKKGEGLELPGKIVPLNKTTELVIQEIGADNVNDPFIRIRLKALQEKLRKLDEEHGKRTIPLHNKIAKLQRRLDERTGWRDKEVEVTQALFDNEEFD